MPELREVFEMTTRQMEPDTDAWREQEQRQRTTRNRKVGTLVIVGAILVAAIVTLEARQGGKPVIPTGR